MIPLSPGYIFTSKHFHRDDFPKDDGLESSTEGSSS